MSLLSRTVTSRLRRHRRELMWTQRQRQMAKDALRASSDRSVDLLDRHGVNLEEAWRDEHAAIATFEPKLRRALAPNRIAVPLDQNHFPGPDMLCHAFHVLYLNMIVY